MLETVNSESLRQVGRSPTRSDAPDKLNGAAIYVSDMTLPGMLYAQVKKSPHARARIKRIDTSRAERLTGVRAVLTGHDLDYKMGLYVVDKDILAKNEVRHFGELRLGCFQQTGNVRRRVLQFVCGSRREEALTFFF